MKTLCQRLGLTILAMGLLFSAGELVVRIVMPMPVRLWKLYVPDDVVGCRLAAGYRMRYQTDEFNTDVVINADGLRGRMYPLEKRPGIYRILILGDSFTLGLQVAEDQTYCAVLAELLNGVPSPSIKRFEVLNAGIEGFGTHQEYLYGTQLVARYKPDLVVVAFHPNDIQEILRGINPIQLRNRLKASFYCLTYLRHLRVLVTPILSGRSPKASFLELYRDPSGPEVQDGIRRVEDYLLKIRALADGANARMLLVLTPMCFEVGREQWVSRGLERLYTADLFQRQMPKLARHFEEFGLTNGIPTLALREPFARQGGHGLYFQLNPHWTPEGHRLAAQEIFRFLRKQELLTPRPPPIEFR